MPAFLSVQAGDFHNYNLQTERHNHPRMTFPKLLTQEASWSRCPNYLHWLLFMSRCSSCNLIPSLMMELLTLSLTESPTTLGAHFRCRYVQSQCFNHCPELAATGDGTYKHWPVNQELLFHTQLSLYHRSLVQHPHHHTTRRRSPAPPSPHLTKPCDT